MSRVSLESDVLNRLEEYYAAGLFENKNAPVANRFSRAARRYFDRVVPPAYEGGTLYPSGNLEIWALLPESKVRFHYSNAIWGDANAILSKADGITDRLERQLLHRSVNEMNQMMQNPIPEKYCIGGGGFTHSIINFERVMKEGLEQYSSRITACRNKEKNPVKVAFYEALQETLEAVISFHGKCVARLEEVPVSERTPELKRLISAMKEVPLRPATSFYEALVSFNFMWYIDGNDSIGRFDQYMFPWFDADIRSGTLTEVDAQQLLESQWANVDACSGWHMILGGMAQNGGSGYTRLTELCLKTLKKYRRPNAGIRINRDMPDHLWELIFDNWADGGVNPALYNEATYMANLTRYTGVKGADQRHLSFGGCTEMMFQGISNVGSVEGGINLLEIFEDALRRNLLECKSYAQFVNRLKREVADSIRTAVEAVNLNEQKMALARPQLIRSLFIDDCIERGEEYNAGGARYNGGVINVGGLTNTINSLLTVRKLFGGELKMAPESFLDMLSRDYQGYENELLQIVKLPKFGNAIDEVDEIAADLSGFIFKEIVKYKSWRGNGFMVPGVIMFVTYTMYGEYVGATPDGRRAGAPLADSVGPQQGTDLQGPTSTLLSCAKIPQKMGIGTLVLNLRFGRRIFADRESREKVKALLKSYFAMDGLQVQVSVADQEVLKKAARDPEAYPHLMVRIGGYSEYFRYLSEALREEVIKRTEQYL